MNARKLLEIVKNRGLSLHRDGENLILSGPEEQKTPKLLAQLRESKAELMALLGGPKLETWLVYEEQLKDRVRVRAIRKKERDDCPDLFYWQEPFWFGPGVKEIQIAGEPKEWSVPQW